MLSYRVTLGAVILSPSGLHLGVFLPNLRQRVGGFVEWVKLIIF